MKKIVGYVRDIPGGEGVSNVPVTIRLAKDGSLVPSGGMAGASVNPINTDANGRFEWTCELSPGPLRVEAAIDVSSEMKVRVGEEVMQADDIFISDIPTMGQMFNDGIIKGLVVSPVIGQMQVSIAAGAANLEGRILEITSSRTIVIDPNPTLDNRIDSVYLEQQLTGPDAGRQQILVSKGTVNNTPPAVTSNASVKRLEVARVTIPQGATSVTVSNVGPTVAPKSIKVEPESIRLSHLHTEVKDKLTDAMFTISSPSSGQVLKYDGSTWKNQTNSLVGLSDTNIASPTANQVLTYSSGAWRNQSLPAPPTVSIAAASDTVISSPAANQVLTYYNGAWRNRALPAPPTVSIAAASDTTITSPSNGQVLAYSGGRWRNSTLNIELPSPRFAQQPFSAYGNLPGQNTLIASTSVSVPAGTWLLQCEASGHMRGVTSSSGTNNIWFQGSAVDGIPLSSRQTSPRTNQGVDRGWHLSTARVVTRSSTGTMTLDLWVSGGYSYFGAGKLTLSAV